MGAHLLKHWSSTQTTISLSSGEAELHGIAKATTHALGFRNMARDLQWTFGIQLFSDAVAAIGIARRRGAGKIRHLDCTDLWVQEKVRTGEVALEKIAGSLNPADLFTKYLARPDLQKNMDRLGIVKTDGRARTAPMIVTPILLPRRSA